MRRETWDTRSETGSQSPATSASPRTDAVEVRTEPLGGSPLARLAGDGGAPDGWYLPRPASPDEWRSRLTNIRDTHPADWHGALADAFRATGAAADRLARVADGRGVVVTTGQQPGLFGGPVYTWSKAISALALADALERATGIPVAPVFWAATDDADFAEARWTIVNGLSGAERLAMEGSDEDGAPMAERALGDVAGLLERLVGAAGSAADPSVLVAARRAYTTETTVGGAYVALLRELLAPLGVAVLDASHPAVTTRAFPLYREALVRGEEIATVVAERDAELRAQGFEPQVASVPGLSLVFERGTKGKVRIPLARAPEVARQAEPGTLSPNVLLRPVAERLLLPTAGYLAGPGELTYFAQVSAVARALDVPALLALPRWSCTILEPRTRELLSRYRLEVDDLRDPHQAEGMLARAAVPQELKAELQALEADVAGRLARLRSMLSSESPLAPARSVDAVEHAIRFRLSRFERRLVAGAKRREEELMRHLAILRGALYPEGKRQERALNLLPVLARRGRGLFDIMLREASLHAKALVGTATERRNVAS